MLLPFTAGLGAPQTSTAMHALPLLESSPSRHRWHVVVQFVGVYVGASRAEWLVLSTFVSGGRGGGLQEEKNGSSPGILAA
jgi:hypothetical protein